MARLVGSALLYVQAVPVIPTPTAINISTPSATVNVGESVQYGARVMYSAGPSRGIFDFPGYEWASSNTTVAAIDATGLATALAVGTTQIAATFMGRTSNAANLTVVEAIAPTGDQQRPARLIITLDPRSNTPITTATVRRGYDLVFTATATYPDGSTRDVSDVVEWRSSARNIAAFDPLNPLDGSITGNNIGTTQVSATLAGVTSNAVTLTVTTL